MSDPSLDAASPRPYGDLVRDLAQEVTAAHITDLDLSFGSFRLRLRRAPAPINTVDVAPPVEEAPSDALPASWIIMTAPLSGTFYTARSPEAPPFAALESRVLPGQVVALIESMKMFNEVVSDITGVTRRYLATNGSTVTAGQPLLAIEPDAAQDTDWDGRSL